MRPVRACAQLICDGVEVHYEFIHSGDHGVVYQRRLCKKLVTEVLAQVANSERRCQDAVAQRAASQRRVPCSACFKLCIPEHRRSVTGYAFTLCGGPTNWASPCQKTVARSSSRPSTTPRQGR